MDLIKKNLNSKLYPLIGTIFTIHTILLTRTCPHHEAGLTCISPHIIDNWLRSYENGFVGNGLLGHIHSLLIGNNVNVIGINLLGFGIIALNLFFIYRSFLKESIVTSSQILFLFILLTPLFSVYINTLGHTFHFCLAVFSLTLIALRNLTKKIHRIVLISISTLLMGLIHESSLILIVPSFVAIFLNPYSKKFFKKGLFLITLYYLILLGFVLGTNYYNLDFSNVRSYLAFNPIDGMTHIPIEYQNLASSIGYELKIIYGVKNSLLKLMLRAISVSIFPILVSMMISITKINYFEGIRFLKLLLFTWLYTLPLYFFNNLWGGIAISNLVTTIFIYETSSSIFEAKNSKLNKINRFDVYWGFIKDNNLKILLLISFLILFLYPVHNQTWLRGVSASASVMIIPLIAVIGFIFKNNFPKSLIK